VADSTLGSGGHPQAERTGENGMDEEVGLSSSPRMSFRAASQLLTTSRKVTVSAGVLLGVLTGATAAAVGQNAALSVELNKLESSDKGCRAYVVINNTTDATYDVMKMDLVMFQPDGVIGKRFVLDLAPLKSQKKTVKLFSLEDTACDKVGSLLVNDIVECKVGGEVQNDCLARITLSTLTTVTISK
jgi:hypothetical protein